MASTEVIPFGQRTLDELASEIDDGHRLVLEGLTTALQAAIQTGDDLLEAQAMLEVGQFDAWRQENTSLSRMTAKRYMRIAEFQQLLPNVTDMSIGQAIAYLKQIGAQRQGPVMTTAVDTVEVKRLRDGGMKLQDISDMLGISVSAAWLACLPNAERKRELARRRELNARRRRLLKRAERIEAMNKASGDLAEAYSLVRRALQHAQAAHDQYPKNNPKRSLAASISHLHKAEDALSKSRIEQETSGT